MRHLILLLLFSVFDECWGQSTQIAPDCNIPFVLTTAAQRVPSTGFANDSTSGGGQAGCVLWTIQYSSTGFSALSLRLESAADSSGVAGSWGAFSGTIVNGGAAGATSGPGINPNTDTNWAFTMMLGGPAWVSVKLTSKTGTGQISGRLVGWRGNSISQTSASAAPSGPAGGDLSGTYPNPTVAKINTVALGSTTATAGNILIGSGTEWVTKPLSGSCTLASSGAITCAGADIWQRSAANISPVNAGDTVTVGTTVLNPTTGIQTPAVSVGSSGTTGSLALSGATSGTVSIQPQATTSTFNFNLPTTAGTSGFALLSAGGGSSPMTWGAVAGLAANTFTGIQTIPDGSASAPTLKWASMDANTGLFATASTISFSYQGTTRAVFTTNAFWQQDQSGFLLFGNSADVLLGRQAAATLRFGDTDAASPVAQTTTVQSVATGTMNTAGAAWTLAGSKGTGSGVGGNIIFKVSPAGGSGTSQNASSTALTIDATNSLVTGTFKIKGAGGFQSADGSDGVTVAACTSFKNGLCVAGT